MGHKRLNKARKQSANTKKGRRQGALRKKEDKKQKKKFHNYHETDTNRPRMVDWDGMVDKRW